MKKLFFIILMMTSLAQAAIDYKSLQFLDGCTIYSIGKTPKVYPGAMCIFLDDGSFISAGHTLKRIGPDLNVMWEVPGIFHHQINISGDRKRILALSTEIKKVDNKMFRDDVLQIISIDGKVLHSRTMEDLYRESKIEMMVSPHIDQSAKKLGAQFERSHFNSIYEIPVNDLSSKLESHKEGNIIANSLRIGTFIFTPDLSKILYHKLISYHHIHDLQVRKTGELIYFNNSVVYRFDNPYSAIEQFDPVTDKVTFSYTGKPKSIFFSSGRGGVQEFDDDTIFFSDQFHGGFFYSRKKGTIIESIPGKYGNVMTQEYIQQIKIIQKQTK